MGRKEAKTRTILVEYLECRHHNEEPEPDGWTTEDRMLAAISGVAEKGKCPPCVRRDRREAKMGQRERIEAGEVSKGVRQQMDQHELDHWAGLTDLQRSRFYSEAIVDHQVAHAHENSFINNLGGQGTAQGRGGCLVMAIRQAWQQSQANRDRATAEAEAKRQQKIACQECGEEFVGDQMLIGGATAFCFSCVWEKYPESAKMLELPRL